MIILISGKRFSGKDTFAKVLKNILCAKLPQKTIKISHFADHLKCKFAKVNDLDLSQLMINGPYKNKHRAKLIEFAQDAKMSDQNIWVKSLTKFITEQNVDITIVPDLRFKHELNEILNFGTNPDTLNVVVTIRMQSSTTIRESRGWAFDEKIDGHISEVELDNFEYFDFVVGNHTNNLENIGAVAMNIVEKIICNK